MTKSELIEVITAKQKHLPAKDVELALKQILEIMSDALSQGERIEIRGFGSFSLLPKQRILFNAGKGLRIGGRALDIPYIALNPGASFRGRIPFSGASPTRPHPFTGASLERPSMVVSGRLHSSLVTV